MLAQSPLKKPYFPKNDQLKLAKANIDISQKKYSEEAS